MNRNIAAILYSAAFSAFVATAYADSENKIPINVALYPSDSDTTLSLSLGFVEEEVARPIENKIYYIPLSIPSDTNDLIAPQLMARWGNNSFRLVTLSNYVYFLDNTISVYFYGPQELNFECRDAIPQNAPTAFEILFRCRDIVVQQERNNLRWTPRHLRALDAWHRANRFMTDRLVDAQRRSPYGLDPELISRLREIHRLVEVEGFKASHFRPVRYADVIATLRMHEQSKIALAGLTENLINRNELEKAQLINSIAISAFEELSNTEFGFELSDSFTVQGTNLRMLRKNIAYIESLKASSSTDSRM